MIEYLWTSNPGMASLQRRPNGPATQHATVIRPPKNYDHRVHLMEESKQIIRHMYPELQDLSESGTLLAIPRPENYVERRADGYSEPEVVYIVGTAHTSNESAEEVARVIQAIRPENVVVELCRSRSSVMYEEDRIKRMSDSGKGWFDLTGGENMADTFWKTLQLGGASALFLRLLLSRVSSMMAERMEVGTVGVEFVAARKTAEDIDAQIVLGDRPIEITLRRAWESLSAVQKLKFIGMLVGGILGKNSHLANVEALERLRKDDDAVNALLYNLADSFPELAQSLVFERDLYLAWSLKRSKAVNGTKNVVGVIGKGHMRGVSYALTHDAGTLRFRDLAGSRNPSEKTIKDGLARFALETSIFAAIYAIWTLSISH